MSTDPEILALAETHTAPIRHELLMLLSEQAYPEISSMQARKSLQTQAVYALNALLKKETNKDGLGGLFFTNFIVE